MTRPADVQTIAALLTAPNVGAIAVIALAGSQSAEIIRRMTRGARPADGADPPPDRPAVRRLYDGDAMLDDAVIVNIPTASGSAFEIAVHGGIRIAQRVLDLLERHGARLVANQEFPLYRDPDPVVADIDRALMAASSRRLTVWLLNQRTLLPAFLQRWPVTTGDERTAFLRRSEVASRLIRGLHLAIVGPPNAGKSTLANRLIGRERIITADVPGTTRDWVSEPATIRGWPVTLVDTAGVRPTECPIEAESIRRGAAQVERVDLQIVVVDASDGARRGNVDSVAARTARIPTIVAANKIDLIPPNSPPPQFALPGAPTIHLSARTGQGLDLLEQSIEHTLQLDLLDDTLPAAFNESQWQSLA